MGIAHNEQMEAWKEALLYLPGQPEETKWLKSKLETLSAREEIILQAALQRQPAKASEDVIRSVLSIPYYEVCPNVDSYADLGRFFMEYENTTKIPPEALAFVDMETLGCRYAALRPGVFTGFCYVQYPPENIKLPHYDGIQLPAEDYSWSLRLKIASDAKPDGVWICLPDYEDIAQDKPGEIEIAFQELEVEFNSECILLDAKCVLPGITDLLEYGDLADLIYDGQELGIMLDERGQGQPDYIRRLLAALEYEGCNTLRNALDIAKNLHCYDMVLESELESYGKQALSGVTGTTLDGCIDYEGYARQLLRQRGFHSALNGTAYIARNTQTFVSSYVHQKPPEMTM